MKNIDKLNEEIEIRHHFYFLDHLTISRRDFQNLDHCLDWIFAGANMNGLHSNLNEKYAISGAWQPVVNAYLDYWQGRKSDKMTTVWQNISKLLTTVSQQIKERELQLVEQREIA